MQLRYFSLLMRGLYNQNLGTYINILKPTGYVMHQQV
jgi:hypothetical protein